MAAPDYAAEIAQLRGAMASGEAEVRTADGSLLKYRTVAEIRAGIAYFEGLAAKASSGRKFARTSYASFGRGD